MEDTLYEMEDMLDLEEEMMREQAQQYEEMEDFFPEAESLAQQQQQQPQQHELQNQSFLGNSPPIANKNSFAPSVTVYPSIWNRDSSALSDPTKNKVQQLLNEQSIDKRKMKKSTTDDFARSMQAERQVALGKDFLAKNQPILVFEKCSKLYIMQETILPSPQRLTHAPSTKSNSDQFIDEITDQSTVPCILACGNRIMLSHRVNSTALTLDSINSKNYSSHQSQYLQQLLSRPIEEIMRDYEELMVQRILSAPQNSSKRGSLGREFQPFEENEDAEDFKNVLYEEEEKKLRFSSTSVTDSSLWVDKYAPKTFTQLLSLEKTNRDVLKAVKRWDKFVFKRDLPVSLTTSNHQSNASKKFGDKPSASSTNESISELDSDGRPRKKVILLCGPPGTGKTTLAHVVANHCGYRPLEINASDDRSPEAIKDLLSRATQNVTLHSDKRPNCIIIDEIDGLDASNTSSLDLLIEILNAPVHQATSNHSKTGGGGNVTKKGSNVFGLTRPLICICNDLYAPVLKDIKRLADIYHFTIPQDLRLVQRLQQICTQEKITPLPSTSLLHELIQATGYDIRSSINSLQFAAYHLQKQLLQQGGHHSQPKQKQQSKGRSMENILESMMKAGLKDDHLDAYQIWQQIFQKHQIDSSTTASSAHSATSPDAVSGISGGIGAGSGSGMINAMDSMLEHGDPNLLIQGIHENMHKVFSYDIHNINRHSYSLEWLSWTNLFSAGIISGNNSNHDFYHQYVTLIAGAAHYCHSVTNKPKLQWPKKDKDQYYQQLQRQNILASLHYINSYTVFHQLTKQRIVLDVISYLIDIIRPKLRSVPLISFSKEELHLFQEVIEIMESCDLRYVPTSASALSPDNPEAAFSSLRRGSGGGGFTKSFGFGKKGNNGSGTDYKMLLHDDLILVLEPNLELLISYHEQQSASDPPPSAPSYSKPPYQASNKKFINNHSIVSAEIRQMIYQEQRKYSIRLKEEKLKELSTIFAAGNPNSSFTATAEELTEQKPLVETSAAPISSTELKEEKTLTYVKPVESHGLSSFLIKRPKETENFFVNKKAKAQQAINDPTGTAATDAAAVAAAATAMKKKKEQRLHYKFNEGYSNAVKRTVYLKDFL